MTATIVDIQIIEREDGAWIEFRWQASGQDWWDALETLKRTIPPEAREYVKEEDHLWRVHSDFEPQLSEIFRNFDAALDAIRSQASFGF